MRQIVLAQNILTIAVLKRKVSATKNICLLSDSLRKQKICFNQCQRKNWVEPLRSFVLSLREAVILEKGENYFAWKKFFQKIGSNPTHKEKTLSCNWGELWEFTASAVGGKGFEKIDSAILAPAKSLRFLNSDNISFGGDGGNRTRVQ